MKCRRRRHHFSAHGVASAVEGARRPRPAGARRHLPAGLQGPCRGPALHRSGPRADPDRPCRPPGGRRHDRPDPGEVHLVSTAEEVADLPFGGPGVAYVTQTTLRSTIPGVIDALQRASRPRRARYAGHLLRHPEPPERRAGAGEAGGPVAGCRRRQQLQLEPPAGDRRRKQGVPCHLIADARALEPAWLRGAETVGITAGASAPESLVQEVIAALGQIGPVEVRFARHRRGCVIPHARGAGEPAVGAGKLRSGQSMGIPLRQADQGRRLCAEAAPAGRKRYPLVLMLEPLFRCNLACAGCGKIDYPDPILNKRLAVANAWTRWTRPACRWSDRRRRAAAAQGDAADRRGHPRRARWSSSAPTPCCWKNGSSSTSRTRTSPGHPPGRRQGPA